MRLIDADEVAKVLREKSKQYADLQPTQNWGTILIRLANIIDMVPTVDAESVIKFNYANQIPSGDSCQLCVELPISKDFYCAYGEKMAGGE